MGLENRNNPYHVGSNFKTELRIGMKFFQEKILKQRVRFKGGGDLIRLIVQKCLQCVKGTNDHPSKTKKDI
jgi:hypothetical protein